MAARSHDWMEDAFRWIRVARERIDEAKNRADRGDCDAALMLVSHATEDRGLAVAYAHVAGVSTDASTRAEAAAKNPRARDFYDRWERMSQQVGAVQRACQRRGA